MGLKKTYASLFRPGFCQNSNYACGPEGLPDFLLANNFYVTVVTGDKLTPCFSGACQHRAERLTAREQHR